MDNFEMTERLVEKTGVTFEEAKNALEACGWDMLDAVIHLERSGRIEAKSGSYTSEAAPRAEAGSARQDAEGSRAGYSSAQSTSRGKDGSFRRFLEKARSFLLDNKLMVFNDSGKEVITMPILFAGIIFLTAFWLVIILMMVSLGKGWRYQFSGKDLGRDSVNGVADAVGDAVEKMGSDIREKINENRKN